MRKKAKTKREVDFFLVQFPVETPISTYRYVITIFFKQADYGCVFLHLVKPTYVKINAK